MNFSKLTVASFLAQALLFLDIAGTKGVLCADTPLEEQKEGNLQRNESWDKSTNLRGNRVLGTVDTNASTGDDTMRQFLVKFKDHDRFMAADMELQSDPHQIMSIPDDDVEVMTFETEEELLLWEQRDDVEYIEPDHMMELFSETVPYGINSVKALSVSDSNVSNRKVCIVDSGYDINHPDLQSSRNFVTGKNFSGSSNWDTDGNGHGTHVTGTIAAIGGNEQGVVGVIRNGQVKLHIVKVFGASGRTTTSTIIQGFNECVSAGANVINMSLGGGSYSQTFNNAIAKAYEQGILVVAAAGNNGSSSKSYPASYPAVMSVAGVDSNNSKYSGSQYNDEVDIAAPGVDVLSTVPGGGYASYKGTSMASPHVAGVAALIWSHFPTKTAQEVRQALESTAQDLGSSGRDDIFGHGLVRADRAYNFLHNGDTNNINYSDLVYLQNNFMDNRWLNGARGSGNKRVTTRDHFGNTSERDTLGTVYEWIVRSEAGNGSRRVDTDPKNGQCVKFGDLVYLQNNFMDSRWLNGCRGSWNGGVNTRNHLGSSYEKFSVAKAYQWIVRSEAGSGNKLDNDPKEGQCVKDDESIYLQNNFMDSRWLNGSRGKWNKGVTTRDHLGSTYERETVAKAYKWTVKKDRGDGSRS